MISRSALAPQIQPGHGRPPESVNRTSATLAVEAINNKPSPRRLRELAASQAAAAVAAEALRSTQELSQNPTSNRYDKEDENLLLGFRAFLQFMDEGRSLPKENTSDNGPVAADRSEPEEARNLLAEILLNHAGGEQAPSLEQQSGISCFLERLDLLTNASRLKPGDKDPFSTLAQRKDSQGHSLLYQAISKEIIPLTQWLLNTQPSSSSLTAPFTGPQDEKTSPLHLAAEKGLKEMASLLLDKGADIDASHWGETPLHRAASCGHTNIVDLLLKKGADINAQTLRDLQSPLHFAVEHDHTEIVELLLDSGADVNAQALYEGRPLHQAAARGHIKIASLLLDKGACVNGPDIYNNVPLFFAVTNREIEMVRFLFDRGADASPQNLDYETPLLWAAMHNQCEMTALLLRKGADVHASNKYDDSPLHLAAANGGIKTAELLLDNGADVEALNGEYQAPLQKAVVNEHWEMVNFLLGRGADKEGLNKCGQYSLVMAPWKKYPRIANLVSHYHIDVLDE